MWAPAQKVSIYFFVFYAVASNLYSPLKYELITCLLIIFVTPNEKSNNRVHGLQFFFYFRFAQTFV